MFIHFLNNEGSVGKWNRHVENFKYQFSKSEKSECLLLAWGYFYRALDHLVFNNECFTDDGPQPWRVSFSPTQIYRAFISGSCGRKKAPVPNKSSSQELQHHLIIKIYAKKLCKNEILKILLKITVFWVFITTFR